MSSYLDELNGVQRAAVEQTDGPVLIIAGPGSGKTRVLTYRIAHIIATNSAAPWEILALTFTNKSAREMKDRISKVVGDRANSVWAGTFHSIFAKILRIEAEKIGFASNFTIYDTEDSNSVLNAIIKEMNLDKQNYTTAVIRNRISSAKSSVITPPLYKQNQDLLRQDQIAKRPAMAEIYEKYMARCKRSGAMDFDDLLLKLLELLTKHPETTQKYRDKFKYVLVDEFQDTNYLQYAIIKKLVAYPNSPRNISVVGDDAQSIYAFRGATIDNILDFEKDFADLKVFKLEQNYRSTQHIVEAANRVISYNSKQIKKSIWTDKPSAQKIKVIKAVTDTEEGRRVADTILEQKNRHHLFNSDIAILYRTNAQSRVFEESLRHYNIPYRIFGGLSFYQRKEVKDLIAYLRLTINPKDEEAFRRVVNYPKRGIGDSSVDKISQSAGAANQTMWEAIPTIDLPTRAKTPLLEFVEMIKDFSAKATKANAYDTASYIFKKSKLLDDLKTDTTIEGIGRLENVNAMLDGIKSFTENDAEGSEDDRSLAGYLQSIALYTDADDNKKEGDFVNLMSVHAAKGLEFKAVFVVGLEEKLFPSFMSMDTPEGLDEERRLFYVAITRAERHLTLSYAQSRYKFGQVRYDEPSRFLSEIPPQIMESSGTSSFGKKDSPVVTSTKPAETMTAKVTGFFSKPTPIITIDPDTFKPSPSDQIQVGLKVLHLKFGEGKVTGIEGVKDNRVATIHFKDIDSPQERKLMLKFAKLQVL